jgi:eukaryotic-like serine/threonine-protein kinase
MSELREQVQANLGAAYTVERELGGGGMSRVFVAYDATLGCRVVLKVLPPELAAGVSLDRFQREIRLATQLKHPNIVPVLGTGDADGLPYYTMPFIEGESLRDRLRRVRVFPVTDAVAMACEVAQALDYAHRHDIVHRDIKPENVLLHEGHAVVADFGICRAITHASDVDPITLAGMAVGTPQYMSPEQAAGEREIDGRSDVYSLGCVLYEMLTGEPPFTGRTAQAVIAKRFAGAVPSLRVVRPEVPIEVERAVLRSLALAPDDRFQTGAEFAEALGAGSARVASSTRPPAAGTRPLPA